MLVRLASEVARELIERQYALNDQPRQAPEVEAAAGAMLHDMDITGDPAEPAPGYHDDHTYPNLNQQLVPADLIDKLQDARQDKQDKRQTRQDERQGLADNTKEMLGTG